MVSTIAMIEEDCQILMQRALLGKFICAFGEDGFGQHGKCDQAQWYKIDTIGVSVIQASTLIDGSLYIGLEGYNADTYGHIATDKNFEIALATFLKAATIDPKAVSWLASPASVQGKNGVTMNIDVPLLLDWA